MRKFFADRGGEQHGGPLSWPGTTDGYPFRGQIPDLKGDEALDIPLGLDYKSQCFRIWKPEEHAAFNGVMDRIVNGWYRQHQRIDRWSEEHGGLIVWLEWVQIYGEAPNSKSPPASGNYQRLNQDGQPAQA